MLRGFFGGLAEPPGAEGSRKGRWARRGLPGLAATAPVGHGDCVPKSLSGFGCLVGLVQGLALVVGAVLAERAGQLASSTRALEGCKGDQTRLSRRAPRDGV